MSAANGWYLAATRDELAEPDCGFARDVGGLPILLRSAEGRVRAFKNVCAHRHAQVVPAGPQRGAVRCQYHGWEYADDGRVSRIPDGASFRGMRGEALCLLEYPLEELGPLLFVRLRPGGAGAGLRAVLGEDTADRLVALFDGRRVILRRDEPCTGDWRDALAAAVGPGTEPRAALFRGAQTRTFLAPSFVLDEAGELGLLRCFEDAADAATRVVWVGVAPAALGPLRRLGSRLRLNALAERAPGAFSRHSVAESRKSAPRDAT